MVLYIGDESTFPENNETFHRIQATRGKVSDGGINPLLFNPSNLLTSLHEGKRNQQIVTLLVHHNSDEIHTEVANIGESLESNRRSS
jgi:hypothetical protein